MQRGTEGIYAVFPEARLGGDQQQITIFNLQIQMNIYVSNLSWGTSSESLQNLFAQFGTQMPPVLQVQSLSF